MNSEDSPSTSILWFNGKLVNEREAQISPFDHGLLTGDGVFETMIAYKSKPFAFTRHYERLSQSADAFGLSIPTPEALRLACEQVAKANDMFPARIRITVTGGRAPLGSEKGTDSENVIVAAAAVPDQPETSDVITVPYVRNEHGALAGLKTTSYGENVIALARAHEMGAREAIFGNVAGNLCEGTGSNIFVVNEGQLLTPPLSSGCLPGVTRSLVLEICKKIGIRLEQSNFPISELIGIDSAFLTSTLRGVQPIERIDGNVLPEVHSDSVSSIRGEFRKLAEKIVDP